VFGILLSLKRYSSGFAHAAPYGLWIYNIALLTLILAASRREPSLYLGLALVNLTASASYYTPPSYAMSGTILLVLLSFQDFTKRHGGPIGGLLLWGFLCFAASPLSFPGTWRFATFREVITIISFFTVVTINSATVFYLARTRRNTI
jgi:hypothetical protein